MGQNFSSEPVVEKETERGHNDIFNVAVSSCQGWRMSQEDNHSLILDLPGEHKAAFFAVFDGHGSARVSKHASEGLWRHLVENDAYIKGNFKEALEASFLTFDREVNESYNAQLAGTTAVSLLIVDNIIYCANIGDSRGVACINCECVPLSYDHKPENPLELKRILAAGGYVLGNRVNGNLALSRAFGDFHYKNNEQLPPEQQIVSPCPDVKTIELNDDVDFLLLACDGIWDVLSSEEVVEFVIARLEQNMEPGLICEQLTTRCLATDYELVIGCDNMTVLLVCYTRGRSWVDFCTDIFNKNTRKLGEPGRARPLYDPNVVDDTQAPETTSTTNTITTPAAPNQVLYDLFDAWKTADKESTSSSVVEEVSYPKREEEEVSAEETSANVDQQTVQGTEEVSNSQESASNQEDDAQLQKEPEPREELVEEEEKEPKCSIKALRDDEDEAGNEKTCPIVGPDDARNEDESEEAEAERCKDGEEEEGEKLEEELEETPDQPEEQEESKEEEAKENVEEAEQSVENSEQADATSTSCGGDGA